MKIIKYITEDDDDHFHDILQRIEKTTRAESLNGILQEAKSSYSLTNIAYVGLGLPFLKPDEPYLAVTYSDEWVQHYQEQNYVDIDPVFLQGLRSSLPVDWDDLDRSSPLVKKLFGEANEFGVGRKGVTIPIRGRIGELALCVITTNYTKNEWEFFKRLYLRDFQLIAGHIHDTILRTHGVKIPDIKLSRRESAVIYWAACGKTNSEIASILSISERTIRYHVDNIRGKLNASNMTHAVGKAIAMNLITGPR